MLSFGFQAYERPIKKGKKRYAQGLPAGLSGWLLHCTCAGTGKGTNFLHPAGQRKPLKKCPASIKLLSLQMRLRFTGVLIIFLLYALQMQAQTFNGTGGSIPASSTTHTCFPINVTGVGTINTSTLGLASMCMTITHPITDDLEILLTAPDGTTIPLAVQISGTNFTNTCFNGTSTNYIKFATGAHTGTFHPEGYLGAMNNGQNANGTWRLCIRDRRGPTSGVLNSWSLTFSNTPAPAPPAYPACATNLPPSVSCANATLVCDFNGLCGSTTVNTPSQPWPGAGFNCIGLNNYTFVKFVASATESAFTVWVPTAAAGNTGGLQMVFFTGTCDNGAITELNCYQHIFPFQSGSELATIIVTRGLVPGNTYYLLIDGLNNDVCTFRIAAKSGVRTVSVSPTNPAICAGQSINLTASGSDGPYNWSPAATLSSPTGATVTASPSATTTYTVNTTTSTGCVINQDVTVTVNDTPVITTQPSPAVQQVCQNGAVTPLTVAANAGSGTITGYQWYISTSNANTGGTALPFATGPSFTPSSASVGTLYFYCRVTNSNGCSTVSQVSGALIIHPAVATPTGSVTVQPTCSSPTGTIVITAPAGANIEYSAGGAFQASGTFTGLAPGTYSITARNSVTGCTSAVRTLIVNNLPAGPPTPTGSVTVQPTCSTPTGTIVITAPAGANYEYSAGGAYQASGTFSGLANGTTYQVTVRDLSTGCVSNPLSLSINPIAGAPPQATATVTQPDCVANNGTGTITVTAPTGADYEYSINGLVYQAGTGFTGLPAGTGYNLTVRQISTGCVSAPLAIAINALVTPPAPGVTSPVTYCQGAPATALTATGSNLMWYTSAPGDPGSPTAPVPSTVTAGSVTYFVSQKVGTCESPRASITVVVNAAPAAPVVTPALTYCQGEPAAQLSATGTGLTWYNTASGGTGSSTAPVPNTGSAGTQNFYVSQTLNGCEGPRALITVTVNPVPAPPAVNSPVIYCFNAPVAALAATGSNLLWYSTATGGTGSTTAPPASSATDGTFAYYVSQTLNGCESGRAVINVTVHPETPAPAVVSPVGYCQNSPAQALSATGSNLQWYSVPVGGTAGTVAPIPSTANSGSQLYYVSQTLNGCESQRAVINVNIGPAPAAPVVSSPVTYCQFATAAALSATGTNLLWYTAATGGTGTATAPTPSTASAGTSSWYVSQTQNGCEGPRSQIQVIVNAAPAAPVVSTPVLYCQNSTASALSATGASLLWYAAATGGTGTATAPTPSTAAAGNTVYYVSQTVSGCESERTSLTVTVNELPAAPLVNSPVTYCQNASTVPLSATGSNLLWYGSATGGTGSSTAPQPVSTAAGSTDFFVSQTVNGCESNRATLTVIINPAPAAPVVISPVILCQNSTAQPLTATGSNLLWYDAATGGTGSVTAPTPATASPGNTFYYVSQTVNGCESPRRAITVTVTSSSTAVSSFSYNPGTVCLNGINPAPAYAPGFTPGGVFSATPAGLSIDPATGIVNLAASTAGNYQVTYNYASNGCITGSSFSSGLSLQPAVSTVTVFSYNSPVCKDLGNVSPNLANGFTLGGSFSSTPGLSVDNSSGVINIAASQPGTYQITYRLPELGCRLATSNFAFITINDTSSPVTAFTYDQTDVCVSTGVNPVIRRQPGFSTGGVFSASPAGLNLDATTGAINIGLSVPGVYEVRYELPASGCRFAGSHRLSFIVRAFGSPVTGFSYFSPVCSGDDSATVVPVPGFTPGGVFSSGPGLQLNAATGVIDLVNSLPGNYTVTYQVSAGVCNPAGSGSSTIRILELPAPPTAAAAGICGPGTVTLEANALGTISWYTDPALSNMVNVGNRFSTSISNSTQFYVTNTVGTCESRATRVEAFVSPLPVPPVLGNDTAICPGDRLVLSPGTYNYSAYLWQDGQTGSSYAVTDAGAYQVVVSTGPGCTDTAAINISLLESCNDILFPSAFAPGGRNRSFGALGNYSTITRYALRIFNRYGEEVFATANPSARWDGTYKGKPVAVGAYAWVATYIYRNRIQRTQKGTVMVIR